MRHTTNRLQKPELFFLKDAMLKICTFNGKNGNPSEAMPVSKHFVTAKSNIQMSVFDSLQLHNLESRENNICSSCCRLLRHSEHWPFNA